MRKIGGMFGKKHSEESKKKMSIAKKGKHISLKTEFKKGNVPWAKGKNKKDNPELYSGERHWKYAGDKIGYAGIHTWIKKELGKPSKCSKCDTEKSKRFMWHNISGEYKRDVKDWEGVCAKCHAHMHENWRKRWL